MLSNPVINDIKTLLEERLKIGIPLSGEFVGVLREPFRIPANINMIHTLERLFIQ